LELKKAPLPIYFHFIQEGKETNPPLQPSMAGWGVFANGLAVAFSAVVGNPGSKLWAGRYFATGAVGRAAKGSLDKT